MADIMRMRMFKIVAYWNSQLLSIVMQLCRHCHCQGILQTFYIHDKFKNLFHLSSFL